jgi:hypothetical protein
MMNRRMMLHWMRHGGWGPCGPGWGRGSEWSDEEMIPFLEEYQRDLEQEVEDVAERIKRLKEEKANA